MVSPYVPWPLHGGGGIRIYHLLKELKRHGHETVLLAGTPDRDASVDSAVLSLCSRVSTFLIPPVSGLASYLGSLVSTSPYPASKFAAPEFRSAWKQLPHSERFDLVWINFSIMAGVLRVDPPRDTVVVLEEHESQQLVWRDFTQDGSPAQRLFARWNLLKLRRFEREILRRVNAVVSVSDLEAGLMRELVPAGVEVWTAPNGADTEYFQPIPLARRNPRSILLSGNMSVKRNIDAALWFVNGVFPAVRAKVPDANLLIVGASPAPEIRTLADQRGITVTGTVDDMRDYHAQARLMVAPYRFGAGTKLKVVEAMACGTPVVSTSIGCRGLDAVNGEHLLVADTKTEFALAVVRLMQDARQAEQLAGAARRLAKDRYSWRSIYASLEPKVSALVERKSSAHGRREAPVPMEQEA